MPLAESLSVTNEASQSLEKVTSEVKVFEKFQNHSCDNPDYEALVGALNTLNQNISLDIGLLCISFEFVQKCTLAYLLVMYHFVLSY